MPTENRSSNTDPRDVFIRLNPLGLGEAELRKDSTGFEDQRTHSDYLLFLAGYRETHPEPQPHADPGEVERLRAELEIVKNNDLKWQGLLEQEAEIKTLRAQLAERDALLNRAVQAWAAADTISDMDATMAALRDALYASAAPSAPVEIDERQEFESAWSARIERLRIRERGNEFYRVQPNDLYRWNNVQDAWELWQARAALERKPS